LKDLLARKFQYSKGIFAVTDGSRRITKGLHETFGKYVLLQRCEWHKRENVVSYLKAEEQVHYRSRLQRAYSEPEYTTAKKRLYEIRGELEKINRSSANSLTEVLEETLTLHRLGLVEELGISLMTTNTIENLNSQLANYLRKVKYWSSSGMRARWVAVALLQVEKRMRKINNYSALLKIYRFACYNLFKNKDLHIVYLY